MVNFDVIENIADQHAVIINRNRQASMVMPGLSLPIMANSKLLRVSPGFLTMGR